jgi:hypothetical protein
MLDKHRPPDVHHETLLCSCGNHWTAKGRVEKLGVRVSARPGRPYQRGAISQQYRWHYKPSNCPKCNHVYVGVSTKGDG